MVAVQVVAYWTMDEEFPSLIPTGSRAFFFSLLSLAVSVASIIRSLGEGQHYWNTIFIQKWRLSCADWSDLIGQNEKNKTNKKYSFASTESPPPTKWIPAAATTTISRNRDLRLRWEEAGVSLPETSPGIFNIRLVERTAQRRGSICASHLAVPGSIPLTSIENNYTF